MTVIEFVFGLFAGLAIVSALLIAALRNIIYAAFLFFITLFSIAALFVLAGADYLAVSQIIVYVGGVLVLVLFGVMLTNRLTFQGIPQTEIINLMPALGICVLLFGGIALTISPADWQFSMSSSNSTNISTSKTIGFLLFSDYLLPLEAISVLLTVALIGAAYISRRKPPQPRDITAPKKQN